MRELFDVCVAIQRVGVGGAVEPGEFGSLADEFEEKGIVGAEKLVELLVFDEGLHLCCEGLYVSRVCLWLLGKIHQLDLHPSGARKSTFCPARLLGFSPSNPNNL